MEEKLLYVGGPSVKERAETLGIPLEQVQFYAACVHISTIDILETLEAFNRCKSGIDELCNIFERNSASDPVLSDSQIRKQLKYEKNPMRVKELNKMLYGKKRNKRKD